MHDVQFCEYLCEDSSQPLARFSARWPEPPRVGEVIERHLRDSILHYRIYDIRRAVVEAADGGTEVRFVARVRYVGESRARSA